MTPSICQIFPHRIIHGEADTRIFFHVKRAKSEAIIRTVDTDVGVTAIYCFHNLGINRLWIEFGIGDKSRFIVIHEIVSSLPQTLRASLPFFHAFTVCDSFFLFQAW